MVNDIQTELMGKSLEKILGTSSLGTVAFIRCLNPQVVRDLCASPTFVVPGWSIFGVVDHTDVEHRLITADQAVERREEKKHNILFLIDIKAAGAGMDGVYSATREVGELELLKKANVLARKKIPKEYQVIAEKAVRKARRVGGQNTVSPWREFEFYTSCANANDIGAALTKLGLWPIQFDHKPDVSELEKSIRMVERLFLKSGTSTTVEAKIDSLMLINPSEQQRKDLARIMRDAASLTLIEAVERLSVYPHLWLNNLKPGFIGQSLQKIEIVSWRGKNQKPHNWTGLHLDAANNRLNFILDVDAVGAKNYSRLEVRWKGLPEELGKGAIEYSVAVLSGDDELAEKKLVHTGKNPQKCVFTFDDFDIDEGTKFEAVVRIQPLGNEDLSKVTEDFILLFGQATGKATSTVGNEVRALVEGAISLERREDFDDACNKYHNSQYFGKDKKDYITFHYLGKNAKVFCPPLLRAIEEDWANRQGQMGRWIVPVRTDGSQAGEPKFIQFSSGCSTAAGDRLNRASSELSQLALKSQGLVGMILGFNKIVEEYINAWLSVMETGEPFLMLANTIEVQLLSGKTVGLIVLPSHPLRLAWHHGYDTLLPFFRYEAGISAKKIKEIVEAVDGAHFPAFLPGLKPGESFVFGDTLGFYTVAMVSDHDREPKSSIAILAKALFGGKEDVAPSIGKTTSDVLAEEISRYIVLHPDYELTESMLYALAMA